MEGRSQRRPMQFNLQVLMLLFLVAAMALGWWRTHDRLAQSHAQLEAMRRAQQIEREGGSMAVTEMASEPAREIQTPAQFIALLREIDDWYEYADEVAAPFAKNSVADETIPLLLDLLQDPDPEIRTRALVALWEIKRKPNVVVPALIRMLGDNDTNVRWQAAYALGEYGEDAREGIPALALQMNDDASPIAAFAAMMIRRIDDTIATEPRLVQLLSNSVGRNRERAIEGLADLATPTALEAIVREYRHETDPKLRDQMAGTIARMDETLNPKTAEQSREPERRSQVDSD